MAAAAAAAAVTVTVMLSCDRGGSDDALAFVQLRACVPPDARDDSRGSASRKVLVGLLVLLLLLLLPVVAVEQDRSFVLKKAVKRGFLKRKILVQKNPAWTLGPSLASRLLLTRGIPLLTFL